LPSTAGGALHPNKGILRPLGSIYILFVIGTLLTPSGIVNRQDIVDLRIIRKLLLFEGDAILDIRLPGTGTGAVYRVSYTAKIIKCPLVLV
jgi:hypothetical protein